MKKVLSFILITILCVLPLCSCSTDFSDTVSGAMDDLYQGIKEIAEPFLKQDEKYNSSSGDTNGGNSDNTNTQAKPEAPIGTHVGERLPSFELQCFDETGLLNEYVDPTKTGKVTVINFWGIWCHYCLEELPAFSAVASEYKDDVVVVAIHSVDSFKQGAVNYVRTDYADSDIIFAADVNLDGGFDDCYTAFGATHGSYPFTVIIDENGIITCSRIGAMSKATLENEIEKALGN